MTFCTKLKKPLFEQFPPQFWTSIVPEIAPPIPIISIDPGSLDGANLAPSRHYPARPRPLQLAPAHGGRCVNNTGLLSGLASTPLIGEWAQPGQPPATQPPRCDTRLSHRRNRTATIFPPPSDSTLPLVHPRKSPARLRSVTRLWLTRTVFSKTTTCSTFSVRSAQPVMIPLDLRHARF